MHINNWSACRYRNCIFTRFRTEIAHMRISKSWIHKLINALITFNSFRSANKVLNQEKKNEWIRLTLLLMFSSVLPTIYDSHIQTKKTKRKHRISFDIHAIFAANILGQINFAACQHLGYAPSDTFRWCMNNNILFASALSEIWNTVVIHSWDTSIQRKRKSIMRKISFKYHIFRMERRRFLYFWNNGRHFSEESQTLHAEKWNFASRERCRKILISNNPIWNGAGNEFNTNKLRLAANELH